MQPKSAERFTKAPETTREGTSSIHVNYTALAAAVADLDLFAALLDMGCNYTPYATSELVCHSNRKMQEQTNQVYRKLYAIEGALANVASQTAQVLSDAGFAFMDTEAVSIRDFDARIEQLYQRK